MEVKDLKGYDAHKPFPTFVNLSFTFQLRSFLKGLSVEPEDFEQTGWYILLDISSYGPVG